MSKNTEDKYETACLSFCAAYLLAAIILGLSGYLSARLSFTLLFVFVLTNALLRVYFDDFGIEDAGKIENVSRS